MELRTLVLGPSFMPVSVFPDLYTIPAKEAIVRYLMDKHEVVHWYDKKVLTPSRDDLYWPSIIVSPKHSIRANVRLSKKTLYVRDHQSCFWCGVVISLSELTYEHVIPRSKGGKHEWTNVASACSRCNLRKGNKMPVGEWKPKRNPHKPTYFELLEIRKKFPVKIMDPAWADFLPGFLNVEITS